MLTNCLPGHRSEPANSAHAYAFFDVDDTVISVKSMLSFQDYWYTKHNDEAGRQCYERDLSDRHQPGACWADLNRRYYRHFAGRSVEAVRQCVAEWLAYIEAATPCFFHRNVVAELHRHQAAGCQAVFVSGSFTELLEPIARRLQVEHVLAINMEMVNGHYTGEILPPQTIGDGKARAVAEFLARNGVGADVCYAYGDDISDLPMLQAVAFPVAVRGGRGLEQRAMEMGWRVLSPG